ncbi:acyl-CoA dehydrogenase [Pararhodospirillum photometricum]|uniref:3-methylmercaptopropionyl-CoA dehydrogenase n=1 Tax=Pararhodospirillum photometricum DSM 122 TaxID=1150469 RepID=H6SPJ3_PARPM|nr:acyl-CoA dehydrogenase [Pararhodospirillum photometricum]CCG09518.1 Acyl-CoA dehydrogenase [Pararhodospirillum photometricum DSM 122]
MTVYKAPIADLTLALRTAGLAEVAALPGCEEVSDDLVAAILEEAGKVAEGVLAPLHTVADRQGCHLEDGRVITPEGFPDAYRQFCEGGWNGVPFDPEHGGQGLPWLVATAVQEMWQSANMAFALAPLLTAGAVELLSHHGTAAQKAFWLPRLISGEWSGTMNLTEPQAGSDLAAVRTRAERAPDLGPGMYRIFGTKIFITHGDQDMTDNIVHMVLARLPDAPPGIKGISLFIVPHRLVDDAGTLDAVNDVRCVSLEHKLGIHGSPTCVMAFGDQGGAIGTLVGEENHGIEYMFTMMNNARLGVGVQGVGVAERACQAALAYATERVQGPNVVTRGPGSVSIVHHPDVRRMLLTMRALTQAARLITLATAAALDGAERHPDPVARAEAEARAALLTPLAKGWSTNMGVVVADLGVQVHGGMGYIEETGAAQLLRDVRITPIYEGTNGIQALDLIGRKTVRDGGQALARLLGDMRVTRDKAAPALATALERGMDDLEAARAWILEHADAVTTQAAATPFLALAGLVVGGWLLVEQAERAPQDAPGRAKQAQTVASFFVHQLLPATSGHLAAIKAGAADLLALDADGLASA